MRKIILLGAVLALGGCAGAGGGLESAGNAICKNQIAARAGIQIAWALAEREPDAVKREALLVPLRISLAALDKCPVL